MADTTELAQPATNGATHSGKPVPTLTVTEWPDPETITHPQTAEIIRQVEYYFSEESLRGDRNMLGLIVEGDGWMSLNEMLGWRKMRQFKPKSAVKEAVKQSKMVIVSDNGKRIKRRYPLLTPLRVKPKISVDRKRIVVPEDKPWLTKGMMRPTGFETNAIDGPVKPADYEQDRQDYDPEIVFTARIETAVTRFCARRKMHQQTRYIFEKFMIYGGMESGSRQFIGGLDEKTMDDYSKKEIAELTSQYGVSEIVHDGIDDEAGNGEATWFVDFEAIAKGFLSSQFTSYFAWYDGKQVATVTNVLRNFYNYLLLHDVCPEYKDQLIAALKVCDQAGEELPKLREVDSRLPGDFNVACSTLFGGHHADLYGGDSDWARQDDRLGLSKEDALRVFTTGIFAYGTEEQLRKIEEAKLQTSALKVVTEEELGLEIIRIELTTEEAKAVYSDPILTDTVVRPMGKLVCKRWEIPHAAPVDLPQYAIEAQKAQTFEFLIEEDLLKFCQPGMKMEVIVKELDLGIKWIDYVDSTYATFFTWLANERIREWKEPGPPKGWMRRQNGQDDGTAAEYEQNGDGAVEDGESGSDEPD